MPWSPVPPEIQAGPAKLAVLGKTDLPAGAQGFRQLCPEKVPGGSLGEMWAKQLGLVLLQT